MAFSRGVLLVCALLCSSLDKATSQPIPYEYYIPVPILPILPIVPPPVPPPPVIEYRRYFYDVAKREADLESAIQPNQ